MRIKKKMKVRNKTSCKNCDVNLLLSLYITYYVTDRVTTIYKVINSSYGEDILIYTIQAHCYYI